jgi:hypothetical protein
MHKTDGPRPFWQALIPLCYTFTDGITDSLIDIWALLPAEQTSPLYFLHSCKFQRSVNKDTYGGEC